MKVIKKVTIWTLVTLIFLLAQGAFLIYLYEDDIKQLAISKLNEHLNTKISVGPVSLSLFKHFPNASITFPDIQMKEALPGSNENLMVAKNLSLIFNIWDLLEKNYTIKKLYLEDAYIKLKIDKNSQPNYLFWKQTKGIANNKLNIKIKDIQFKNVSIHYHDILNHQFYSVHCNNTKLSGNFSAQQFDLKLNGNLTVGQIRIDGITYLKNKKLNANTQIKVDLNKNLYTFNKSKISLQEIDLTIEGTLTHSLNDKYVNLNIKGNNVTIQSFISLLPPEYSRYFNDYQSTGDFYLDTKIQGNYDGKKQPLITVRAGVNNGTVLVKNRQLGERTFTQVTFDFSYTNGELHNKTSSSISIPKFSALLEGRIITSTFHLTNFNKPYIKFTINTDVGVQDLLVILKMDNINAASGDIKINANFSGFLEDFCQTSSINKIQSEGSLVLKDCDFNVPKGTLQFTAFNGDFSFKNSDLRIEEFTGKISDSDFQLKGYLRNILPFILLTDQYLEIDAQLKSTQIRLDQLMIAPGTSATDTVYKLKVNPRLICNLQVHIDHLTFERFSAQNIHGDFNLNNQIVNSDHISFNALDGIFFSKLKIDASSKNKVAMDIHANMKQVNIRKLFYEFNNFGLDILKDENLKGNVTATMQISSTYTSSFKINPDRFTAKGNVLIENGELINFQPMLALSRFIDVNELKNLRFSTLENQIEIHDQTVFIPSMEVKSNALNLILSGTHTFNNMIDYKLQILLSELLARKSKKIQEEEFGEIENSPDGKTTLFIRMYGDALNPKFTLDKSAIKNKFISDLKQERQEVKEILKQEFNSWFKKEQIYQEQLNEQAEDWEKDLPQSQKQLNQTTGTKDTVKNKTRFQRLKEKLNEPVEGED